MDHIVEPLKPDRARRHPVSRRAVLEGSASLVAAAAGWGGAALRPGDANAADASPRPDGSIPHPTGGGAGLSRRAAALASVERRRSALRRQARSLPKPLPHNDAGEVDADAFATFVSVLFRRDPTSFRDDPRDQRAEVELNDPAGTYSYDRWPR